MKRKYSVLVAALLILSLVAGCANGTAADSAADQGESVSQPQEVESSEPEAVEPNNENPVEAPVAASGSTAVIDTIMSGFSAKSFADGQVSNEAIQLILESGAKAPSARNLQPWRFTVVTGEAASQILNSTPEGGVVIVISGTSEEMEGVDVSYDCGLATQNMYIAAQSLGLGAHIYSGGVRQVNEKREELGIPEGYNAIAMLLVAHLDPEVDGVASASIREELSDVVNYVE